MLNEFRQDLVSGDWVLFSTGRAKGHLNKSIKFYQPREDCPFDDPQNQDQGEPIAAYHKGSKLSWSGKFNQEWTVQVLPNKFPAVRQEISIEPLENHGPFRTANALGSHELVITKDHDRNFCSFTQQETAEIISIFKERHLDISKKGTSKYISIFHNHGPAAGGTIYHNHSQILSTPIIPPEILRSIKGSQSFYKENKKKVHDIMIEWEMRESKRVIYENDKFIAFCPFVSKTPYEVRIFPKESNPRFELITGTEISQLAEILNIVLRKIFKVLDEPNYNFYIHTASVGQDSESDYQSYHWHLEIVPRLSITGGAELSTDVYINVVDPDEAAKSLRGTTI